MADKIFARRIKELRVSSGRTQESLARELGVSWITVSRWERGTSEPPLHQLRRIAETLGVQPSELLEEAAA